MKTGITINDQHVSIPYTWEDVTFSQYLSMKDCKDDAALLSVLTGFNIELCQQIKPEILSAILSPVESLGEPEMLEDVQILGGPVPSRVGSMEFARKVNCDALSRNYQDEEMIGRMVAIYCSQGIEDEDIELTYALILSEPVTHVVSAGRLISNQLIELQKNEKLIKQPEYESEEWSAGITEFKKYGVFGLVRSIALRHHCTLEDVFKWSYNSVLLELQYSADENAYQRKLNKILNRKK